MIANVRSKFEDILFEYRHHAYVEMAWYFGMCLLINIVFGVWGIISIDTAATASLSDAVPSVSQSQQQSCQLINDFLFLYVVLSFVDAFLNSCLILALPSIMRGPKWAGCGLCSLSLFGILVLGKVIAIILGAVWIMGREGRACSPLLPKFYSHSQSYFIGATIILSLQITVGTCFLFLLGLHTAVEEGVDKIEQEALMREGRNERKEKRERV